MNETFNTGSLHAIPEAEHHPSLDHDPKTSRPPSDGQLSKIIPEWKVKNLIDHLKCEREKCLRDAEILTKKADLLFNLRIKVELEVLES